LKILLLDIETAPNVAHVWGIWQQNVAINQLMASGYTLCWAARWIGMTETIFDSVYISSTKSMLTHIHSLLDEADAVIHYNGTKFDIPTLNKEFLLHGLTPPSPYKQIDLLRVARNKFKFPSNKLDYVAQVLGLGKKTKHIGHELWVGCMNDDPECWKMMQEYNIQDVLLLEKVYHKLKPWIANHANYALHSTDGLCCPNCGSDSYQKRGVYYTHNCQYQRYRCSRCGTWFRSTKNITIKKDKFVYAA
jgi:DNA polymerase elongation subunit (family B)